MLKEKILYTSKKTALKFKVNDVYYWFITEVIFMAYKDPLVAQFEHTLY